MWAKKKWKCTLLRGDKNGWAGRAGTGMRRNPTLSGGSGLVWGKICIKPKMYEWVFLISAKPGRGYASKRITSLMLSGPAYDKQGGNKDSSPLSSLLLWSESDSQSVLGSATLIRCWHKILFRKKFLVMDEKVWKHHLTVISTRWKSCRKLIWKEKYVWQANVITGVTSLNSG